MNLPAYSLFSTAILPRPLIQEDQLSVNGDRMYVFKSTCKLPLGGLPRTSVARITDHPDMTSAIYRGRKALNEKKHR